MSENLLELVKKGESEEIELKKSTAQLERALKSVCSFLNHRGGRVYWDSQIYTEVSLRDIDEEKVRWFVNKAKTERNLKIDEKLPISELLERLELAKNGELTNAAVLLFARNPQKFFLQAETRCARFKGIKPVKPFIDMKVFGGDILDQVDKSLNFVLDHISMAVWLVSGQAAREERYEYPPDAVREAIINAICHRDYSLPSNMQIRVFDDIFNSRKNGKE